MLPQLQQPKEQRDTQKRFRGLVNRLNAGDEEFRSMRNMSSDERPMMAPRKQRRYIRTIGGRTLLGGDKLSWVADGTLYYGGRAVAQDVSEDAQLIRMGAYLIAWPDRIIYNTHTGELSRMDYTWMGEDVHVRPCMLSGQDLEYTASDTEPTTARDGMYWLNTDNGGMYQYLNGAWTGLDTVYARVEGYQIGKGIHDYDVVSISGMDNEYYNLDAATVYARGDDYIVIATGVIMDFENSGIVTVERKSPELDFICESGNRLWGCSNKTHEIRCTKLGDPTNWNSYLGISLDSYAATVGSEGDFTGICTYMGYVHFFKENRVHRLYGTQPSNFQLVELQMRGVKAGCEKSLCVVNELLYYVSRDGVVRYDGSGPANVSEALGETELEQVVCGAHGEKLYLNAVTADGPRMYVWDSAVRYWHMEDETRAVAFASTEEGDFFLDDQGGLWTIDGKHSDLETAEAHDEGEITWEAVSGDILTETTMVKKLKRIEIRVEMERGAGIQLEIMYNSDGRWLRAMSYETQVKKTVTLPLIARACDHFALRYSGHGAVVVYMLTKIYELREGRQCLSYRA